MIIWLNPKYSYTSPCIAANYLFITKKIKLNKKETCLAITRFFFVTRIPMFSENGYTRTVYTIACVPKV